MFYIVLFADWTQKTWTFLKNVKFHLKFARIHYNLCTVLCREKCQVFFSGILHCVHLSTYIINPFMQFTCGHNSCVSSKCSLMPNTEYTINEEINRRNVWNVPISHNFTKLYYIVRILIIRCACLYSIVMVWNSLTKYFEYYFKYSLEKYWIIFVLYFYVRY